MRKIFTLLLTIFICVNLVAQVADKISYQAIVRDSENKLVANTTIGMQISILQNTTPVYVETQMSSTNINGLLTVEIGAGTSDDDFSAIDWQNGPYFIKTEMDLEGGSNYTISGTSEIMTVPFAMHAKLANRALRADYNNLDNKPDLSQFLTTEADASVTNEIQMLSISNDTIYLSGGGFVKLPASVSFGGNFSDLTNIPAGLLDGDDNTQLSETEVDAYVSNNGYLTAEVDGSVTNEIELPLQSGNAGKILTTNGTTPLWSLVSFTDLTNVPSGLIDGDDNTQLTEAQVDTYVSNNGYLTAEVDGSVTNEIQAISISNDTIFLSGGGFVKLPTGTSFSGSFNDLTDKPANLDTDSTDDFDGDFTSLTNVPTGLADGDDNTQLTESQVDTYVSNNGYLTAEVDGSVTNEIELPTQTGQSGKLLTTDGASPSWTTVTTFSGSFNDLTDKPVNLDTDSTDDFDGDFTSLTNVPTGLADGDDNTQLTESQVDTYVSNNGYLTAEVDGSVTNEIELPTQTGQSGKLLTTDGTSPSWTTVTTFSGSFNDLTDKPANLDTDSTDDFDGDFTSLTNVPTGLADGDDNTQLTESQVDTYVSNNGYLTAEVDGSVTNEIELPTQTGNSGKYLTTDGSSPSWATVNSGASQLSELSDVNTSTATSGNILVADGADFQSVSVSGDASLASNGALTIADNSVDGTDIALGSDTQGDIMYYDGTNWVRLAAGTSGQVLQTNGTGANPTWENASGGASKTVTTITSNTTLSTADQTVFINGAFTATLPASPVDGQKIIVCATDIGASINSNGKNMHAFNNTYTTMPFSTWGHELLTLVYSSSIGVWFLSY